MKNKYIKDLTLINDDGKTLFDYGPEQYVVPLYQRDFAWGSENYSNRENEIIQLMDDIIDVQQGSNYYLGSLIVFKRPEQNIFYEVIDGQQRLTALYLLFNCLNYSIAKEYALTYDCRPKSDNALRKIKELLKDDDLLDFDYNKNIFMGIRTIQRKLDIESKNDHEYIEKMKSALKRVHLFRIEVPQCTDLNRYFEIMNTRGEQLEQHDIVKASLISMLDTHEKQKTFTEIWNACSDMSGYVQMHFNPQRRDELFGEKWNECPKELKSLSSDNNNWSETLLSINEVIKPDFSVEAFNNLSSNNESSRFESIITFSHFLLHVLKIFVDCENISNSTSNEKLLDNLLDDKKLIFSFDKVRNNGIQNGEKISQDYFAWNFILYLLRCRFFFDKYIIKREFKVDNSDGEWSLKELQKSEDKESVYFRQTEFNDDSSKHYNKMIQACLRVSYTSPRNMHWITLLLKWISNNKNEIKNYHIFAQKLVAESIRDFVNSQDNQLGVNTPHVVFNFLDFLLWKRSFDVKSPNEFEKSFKDSFDFEFRNSVEHWYPQNPTDREGCSPWNADDVCGTVDRFGNLALLQSSINSRFSNQSPVGKTGYESIIAKGSLKLRLMSQLTKGRESKEWREELCEQHEKEMLEILRTNITEIEKLPI